MFNITVWLYCNFICIIISVKDMIIQEFDI